MYYIGIDIGGTFTDVVVLDQDGATATFKVPTTPRQPSLGFLNGLAAAAEGMGISLHQLLAGTVKLGHGTTIATNLLIERGGARVGLIVTRGFGDTLVMAKIGREHLGLDISFQRPAPLVPRSLTEEVNERIDRDGEIITPLDIEETRAVIRRLVNKGAEGIAVCLLWSFRNPAHERKIRELVAGDFPGMPVSLSSDVAPLIGEYARMATTAANTSIMPAVSDYLTDLSSNLARQGLGVPLLIMQSSGGLVPSREASVQPVTMISSGPAGGVTACEYLGKALGIGNILGIDMGGTSFDASLITGGMPATSSTTRIAGHDVLVPTVEVSSIGAGGGSIAWLDMGRRLMVGPKSAGAEPGPACYNKGGTEPTVTDIDVILGFVNPGYFLGGKMPLDKGKAHDAIATRIARPLGMTVPEAAAGCREIVDKKMADLLRSLTVRQGTDPRDYTIVAFGGAGPAHAGAICRELGMPKFMVPKTASVFSAYGIATSDVLHVLSATEVADLRAVATINRIFHSLAAQAQTQLRKDGFSGDKALLKCYVEMRLKGQSHQLLVPVSPGEMSPDDAAALESRFKQIYEAAYGKATIYPGAEAEIVTFRVDGIGITAKAALKPAPLRSGGAAEALKGARPVFWPAGKAFVETPLYAGSLLQPGDRLNGPAIIEQELTTIPVEPGQSASLDAFGNTWVTDL